MAEPPQLRIDPLSGLRVVVTTGDGPVLTPGGQPAADPLAGGRGEPDLFVAGPAAGAHETIDSPASLFDLDADGLAALVETWGVRMAGHGDAPYVHLTADASGVGQLFALPFVPAAVARERERFTAYSDRTQGRNLLADMLQEEVRRGERLVTVGAGAVAVCPFASRAPFHVQVIPRAPRPRFEEGGDVGAATLFEVLRRLSAALDEPPALDLWIRTAPLGAGAFCWHMDIVPRAGGSGLETGTGVALSRLAPEEAAARLRDAL